MNEIKDSIQGFFVFVIIFLVLFGFLYVVTRPFMGFSSKDNEIIGQVKKVTHQTPIFCYDHDEIDISLGVLRNGVGSMSTQDIWMLVQNDADKKKLVDAQLNNQIVNVKYNVRRLAFCTPAHWITSAEIIK